MNIRGVDFNPFDNASALAQAQGTQTPTRQTAASDSTSQTNETGSSGQAGLTNTAETLGQQDFLKLLVTQLQAQDPLNPQDPTQFTSQLAQFSSLEQLMNLNSAIDQLAQFQAAVANTSLAGFIGNEVTAHGDSISVTGGESSRAEFRLDGNADEVRITIRNGSGAVVRVIELGPTGTGSHEVAWDGLTSGGIAAGDGTYTFEVEATSGGTAVGADTFVRGIVTGVDFDSTGTYLLVDGVRVPLGDLLGVRQPSAAASA